MKQRISVLVALLVVLSMVLTACGGGPHRPRPLQRPLPPATLRQPPLRQLPLPPPAAKR